MRGNHRPITTSAFGLSANLHGRAWRHFILDRSTKRRLMGYINVLEWLVLMDHLSRTGVLRSEITA